MDLACLVRAAACASVLISVGCKAPEKLPVPPQDAQDAVEYLQQYSVDELLCAYEERIRPLYVDADKVKEEANIVEHQERLLDVLGEYCLHADVDVLRYAPRDERRVLALMYNDFGRACMATNQSSLAAYAFCVAVKLDPANADVLFNYGTALWQEDRLMEAVFAFERCLRLDASRIDARVSRENVERELFPQE